MKRPVGGQHTHAQLVKQKNNIFFLISYLLYIAPLFFFILKCRVGNHCYHQGMRTDRNSEIVLYKNGIKIMGMNRYNVNHKMFYSLKENDAMDLSWSKYTLFFILNKVVGWLVGFTMYQINPFQVI